MFIESVMPPNHLILCHPLLLLPSILPSIRVFFNESALHIRWPKYRSFSFSISPSNEYSWLISFIILLFFLIFIFYFTLQYCIGFAIHRHESATGVHVFPNLNPPPTSLLYHLSGLSQCTSPKHPVSCIEPRLAICFFIWCYLCFNAILPNHPTLSLSHRVQKTSLGKLVTSYCAWIILYLFG